MVFPWHWNHFQVVAGFSEYPRWEGKAYYLIFSHTFAVSQKILLFFCFNMGAKKPNCSVLRGSLCAKQVISSLSFEDLGSDPQEAQSTYHQPTSGGISSRDNAEVKRPQRRQRLFHTNTRPCYHQANLRPGKEVQLSSLF